ncbi:hypothetical protein [uncultured Maribacter sp.]|uniref:hypothetical protein n=1 Tax=uncultured Maribacter sp. TaxID=431308 RepID=UPI0026179588|nr:hypothetical protein [uncultured Maribacter sp.]
MFNIFNKKEILFNGYYQAHQSGMSEMTGESYSIYHTIILNRHHFAFYYQDINSSPANIKSEHLIPYKEYNNVDERSHDIGRYQIDENEISIIINELDPNTQKYVENTFTEFTGRISHKKLILSLHKAGYSNALQDFTKEILNKDLIFNFIPVS